MEYGTVIHTTGYRGPITDYVYLDPGEYTVDNTFDVALRLVKSKQAAYIVSIDMARVVSVPDAAPEPDTEDDAEPARVDDDLHGDLHDLPLKTVQAKARANGIAYSGKSKAQLIAELADDAASA